MVNLLVVETRAEETW